MDDDPENQDAWLWLTRTAKTRDEQRQYLQKVLAINPANEPAQKALDLVDKKSKPQKSASKPKVTPFRIVVLATVLIFACVIVAGLGMTALILLRPTPQIASLSSPSPEPTFTAVRTDTPLPTDTPEPTTSPTPPPTETPVPTRVVSDTPRPTETSTSDPVPAYKVEEVEDISVADAVRIRVDVRLEFPVSVEQIKTLCEQIIGDQKQRRALNAVVIFIYDTRSLYPGAYSIAKCEYAPNGDWAEAINVQTGDYGTHQFVYEYQSKVTDPEAALSQRPTEQEYNLCQQWDDLYYTLPEDADPATAETMVSEQIAERNGVSFQTVDDTVSKCYSWTLW